MRKFGRISLLSILIYTIFNVNLFSFGLELLKTIEPGVGFVGDTVTVCLNIAPESITIGGKADIMWIIDITGSMSSGIDNIKNNISYLTTELSARGIDYRQGLVEYRDVYIGQTETAHGFTVDDADFLNKISLITVNGGGDIPESGLDSIVNAASSAWRSDASKTMILVTDAPLKVYEDSYLYSITATAADLVSQGIKVHTVCVDNTSYTYSNSKLVSDLTNGIHLDYYSSTAEWQNFLQVLGSEVANYTNVIVRDPMPPELSPIGDMCGATVNGNVLEWSVPSIWSGGIYNVCCFGATITAAYAGSISNTAYVDADGLTETGSNTGYVFYPSKTTTPTLTPTFSQTETITITSTKTITETVTQTITETQTITPSVTPSITATASYTQTITPTITPTWIPVSLEWKGPFPNPGKSFSNILYSLTRVADVTIKVFTVSGEIVREELQYGTAGINSWHWDLLNKSGRRVASGVYIIRIQAEDKAYYKTSTVWGAAAVVK